MNGSIAIACFALWAAQAAPPLPPGAPSQAAAADAPRVRVACTWAKVAPEDAPEPRSIDEQNRAQLGRLIYARVTIESEGAEAAEVLAALREALGLKLFVYESGRNGLDFSTGIDPATPVDLWLEGVDGRTALETVAAMCGNDVTWQLRDGMVEFGPKRTLAREPAQERRVYELADLSLVPPDWSSAGGGAELRRKSVAKGAGELVRAIAMQCEPDAFEPKAPKFEDEATTPRKPVQQSRSGAAAARAKDDGPDVTANFDPQYGPVLVKGAWATIQMRGTTLIVRAPDFVHRTIQGYGPPIAPKRGQDGG
ncbi:MAG: hypothetical protein ACKOYN_08445 [Planctomycetota bacterium]